MHENQNTSHHITYKPVGGCELISNEIIKADDAIELAINKSCELQLAPPEFLIANTKENLFTLNPNLELIDGNDIPPNTPVILIGKKVEGATIITKPKD